jgi:hypothetical protein
MNHWISFIPIGTTILSIIFFIEMCLHYYQRKKAYLLWWTIGVATFGLGTFTESFNTLIGFQELNFRLWYIVGALLGGFPLAQGSAYLHMPKRFANISSFFFVALISIGAIAALASPINIPVNFDGRLTGKLFTWHWVRLFSPFINMYAFVFLVGGAVFSAVKYSKQAQYKPHFIGNVLIAVGGLLPGIGGTFTRMGYVEVLFVTEFVGLLMIYWGYRIIKHANREFTEK